MITLIAEKKTQAKQYLEGFQLLGIEKLERNTFDFQFEEAHVFQDRIAITWTNGHILQPKKPEEIHPEWGFHAIEKLPFFPERLALKVDEKPERKALFKHIKKLVGKSDRVILGGDADREGALIQIELAEFLGLFKTQKTLERLMITETTPEEVAQSILHLDNLNYTFMLYKGAVARQYLDWVVGMNLSPIYTHSLNSLGYDTGGAYPVGRIKSVVLAMIEKRNEEFEAFIPETYYKGEATFHCEGIDYPGRLLVSDEEKVRGFDGRFFEAQGGLDALEDYFEEQSKGRSQGVISTIIEKDHLEQSPALFSTRTLQEALGFLLPDGSETLSLAEELYNEGYLTYPRTSSKVISEALFYRLAKQVPNFQKLLNNSTALTQLKPRPRYVNTQPLHQKAHEAITVTSKVPKLDVVKEWSEKKQTLYRVVLERCVAMFLPDYKYRQWTITTRVGNLEFQTIEKAIVTSGFKELYGAPLQEEIDALDIKQELKEKETVDVEFVFKKGKTKPKSKYTLISILTALAKVGEEYGESEVAELLTLSEGLGTEATRAAIIKDMREKGLIVVHKRCLEVTPKGKVLVSALQYEPLLCQPLLTAKWEEAIRKVEEGRLSLPVLIKQNQAFILQAIENAKGLRKNQLPQSLTVAWGRCPKCEGALMKRKWDISCRDGCGFMVKREIAHKKLSEVQLKTLVEKGRTKTIKGFKGKNGKFEAALLLDDTFKVVFDYLPQHSLSQKKIK